MRKALLLAAAVLILASCETPRKALYYWGGTAGNCSVYEDLTYKNYKKQTPESLCNLLCAYEAMVNSPGGQRQVPPPGICAEYGYLLLLPETATHFENNATKAQREVFGSTDLVILFREKGESLFKREIELYPESAKFLKPILERLGR